VSQLSRPYQIVLIAVLGLVMVWFVALRGHSSSSSSATSSPPAPKTAPAASSSTLAAREEKSAAAPSSVYQGSAPGVEGLTRAIDRAHQAVATSQQYSQHLQEKSAQASDEAPSSSSASTASASVSSSSSATSTSKSVNPARVILSVGARTPAGQVESELAQGKVVLLFFWNPKSVDDVAVRRELQRVGHSLGRKVAIHQASAGQVSSFGGATENVHVYQTPTILIINHDEQVSTITGFADAFDITQAIDSAKGEITR
jgi:hypothetical protein